MSKKKNSGKKNKNAGKKQNYQNQQKQMVQKKSPVEQEAVEQQVSEELQRLADQQKRAAKQETWDTLIASSDDQARSSVDSLNSWNTLIAADSAERNSWNTLITSRDESGKKASGDSADEDENSKKRFKLSKKQTGIKRSGDALSAAFFCALIMFVFVITIVVPDRDFSENENRMLQSVPKVTSEMYLNGTLGSKFEKYASDQFVLRDAFIRVKSAFDSAAGVVKSNGVWKGRSGYLIEDTTVPADDFMDQTVSAIAKFKKKNSNLRMSFLLAPNAVNIMKKKLPFGANPVDQNKYMDEFYAGIKNAGINTIDVRDSFNEAAADKTQLYYKTDHHWNCNGAALAFDAIRENMKLGDEYDFKLYPVSNSFVGTLSSKSGFTVGRKDMIAVPSRDKGENKNSVYYFPDEKKKTTEYYRMKNLKTKDAYSVFGGTNHAMYTIKTPVKGNKRLLLIKDSYANSVIPYLTQYYTEITVVDPRYYFDSVQDIIDIDGISDVLFLYNANTFFGDNSLRQMLEEDVK